MDPTQQSQPLQPQQPPTPAKPKFRLPTHVKVGLLVFTLAATVILSLLPYLFGRSPATGHSSPPMGLFLLSGLIMVMLTAGLFAYFAKLGMGLTKTMLLLALGYNAAIAVIKFCFAPLAMYGVSETSGIDAMVGDPNTPIYYLLVGGVVLFIYLMVFRLMYGYYRNKSLAAQGIVKTHRNKKKIVITIVVVVGGLILFGGSAVVIPLFFVLPSFQYLQYVLGLAGLPVVCALALAIVLAQKGFDAAQKQEIAVGSSTLLATFFWIGLTLILVYHFMWMVFMLTLVQLWPFNTYTPK